MQCCCCGAASDYRMRQPATHTVCRQQIQQELKRQRDTLVHTHIGIHTTHTYTNTQRALDFWLSLRHFFLSILLSSCAKVWLFDYKMQRGHLWFKRGGGYICTCMWPRMKVSCTAAFTLAAITSALLPSTLLLSNSMSAVTDPIMMARTAKVPATYTA